jgi:hypothetical protein
MLGAMDLGTKIAIVITAAFSLAGAIAGFRRFGANNRYAEVVSKLSETD